MGKWTLEYHDEVLRNKVKNLVQGTIKRMKVEKEGPSITYESFVEELDEGDAFTTTLIDVLVKELAERKQRPNPVDRRLISEKTAKSLRMQAAPLHIYRGSQGSLRDRARRSVPLPPPRPYSATFHDILSDSDGDEEYGTMLGSSGQVEGAQINTDLYDAYLPSTYDLPGSISRSTERNAGSPHPPEPTGSWLMHSPPRSPSTGFGTTGWMGLGGPGSSSLTRQPTVRRPHRSRTIDSSTEFSGFTSRRRTAMRNSATLDDVPRESSGDAVGRSSSIDASRPTESSTAGDIGSRGSLDLSAWMARRRAGASSLGNVSVDELGWPSTSSNPSSSQMWYSMTTSSSASPEPMSLAALSRRSSTTDLNDDRRQSIAPRLRRGGLRPPESLLLHGPASPGDGSSLHSTSTTPSHAPVQVITAQSPPSEQPGAVAESSTPPAGSSVPPSTSGSATPAVESR
ncbi:hypothetical protein GSI_01078 [Ganoderma sinense ZZ0214-1]|uniref:Uncharacterized protein n=1 Tax=Ganoderma sinense ZZ0214-1 TaxID=1077348 RepID=A0A2G8SUF6_9APHY|nr:hypothetical protein GSI_01078 [Ganoderma sinense ZZ0214-1]